MISESVSLELTEFINKALNKERKLLKKLAKRHSKVVTSYRDEHMLTLTQAEFKARHASWTDDHTKGLTQEELWDARRKRDRDVRRGLKVLEISLNSNTQ